MSILIAALLIGCWYLLTPDGIPVADGMGWDGAIYGGFAQDFPGRYHAGVTSYYVSRLLPSLLIYEILRLLGSARSAAHVVLGFRLMNAVLVVAAAGIWVRLARTLRLGISGRVVGFVGLFLNFFMSKMPAYYPVLTDVPGFFIGLCMVWAALERRFLALLVATVLGRFIWPTAVAVGAALLLAPLGGPPRLGRRNRMAAILATAALLLVYVPFTGRMVSENVRIWASISDLVRPVWPLSLALAAVYLAVGLATMGASALAHLRAIRPRDIPWVRTAVTVIVLAGVSLLAARLSTAPGNEMPAETAVRLTCWMSVMAPAQFLVAHAIYFGPVFLLLLGSWRQVQARVAEAGLGMVLALGLAVMLSINSESRYLSNLWPMMVPFVAKEWDGRLTSRQLTGLVMAALLFSKVWLIIGAPSSPIPEYPSQLYFMNQGPWMSAQSYVVQGVAVLALALLLHMAGYFRSRPRPEIELENC